MASKKQQQDSAAEEIDLTSIDISALDFPLPFEGHDVSPVSGEKPKKQKTDFSHEESSLSDDSLSEDRVFDDAFESDFEEDEDTLLDGEE